MTYWESLITYEAILMSTSSSIENKTNKNLYSLRFFCAQKKMFLSSLNRTIQPNIIIPVIDLFKRNSNNQQHT